MLKITKHGQLQRILRDEILSKHLLLVIVDTPGGQQAVEVLTAQAIPTWLTGLQSSMVAPEKRPLILALKEEAVEVLYHHFFHIDPEPQPEQPQTLPGSPFQMIYSALQSIGEAVKVLEAHHQANGEHLMTLDTQHAAMQESQQAMRAWLTTLEGQREAQEEQQQAMGEQLVAARERQEVAEEHWKVLGDYVVETRERVTALEQQRRRDAPGDRAEREMASGSVVLSPQHVGQVYALAREERQRSGISISEQLAALAEAFGVPDMSDLPDSAWQDVLAWFWERRQRR